MKKILLGISIASSLLLFQSCNEEDFLGTQPSETISSPTTEQKINGLFANMIIAGTGGTTRHEDFGQKGVDILTDMLTADVALSRNGYNRYAAFASLAATSDYTSDFNYIPWRYYYKIIYGANDVMNDFGDNPVLVTNNDKAFYGQALAMRAYSYFYLLQMYTKEYEPSAKAIPLVTSIKQTTAPSKTQKEIYDLIVSDLLKAEELLANEARNNKIKVDQTVVRGLLAYTYAAMNQNQLAADYSKKVMDAGYPLTTKAELTGGFNDLQTKSWIWGADITTDMSMDLISWWGQMDWYTYSYQSVGDYKCIDDNLRKSISDTDVRKSQFKEIVANYWMGSDKFYDSGKVRQGARIISADYIFMRVDEFYLLYAESMAKLGNDNVAKTTLKTLLKDRYTDLSFIDALSGTALQDEIYKQTRIEFWGEGKTYLALKRNKKDVVRGANHNSLANQTIKFSDDRLTFKIPQAEVINNPDL